MALSLSPSTEEKMDHQETGYESRSSLHYHEEQEKVAAEETDEERRHSAHEFPVPAVNVKALASLFQQKLSLREHSIQHRPPHSQKKNADDDHESKVKMRRQSFDTRTSRGDSTNVAIPSTSIPNISNRESTQSMDDISHLQPVLGQSLSNSSDNLPIPRPRMSVLRKKWTNDILFFNERLFAHLPDDELYANEPEPSDDIKRSDQKTTSNRIEENDELYEIPNDCDSKAISIPPKPDAIRNSISRPREPPPPPPPPVPEKSQSHWTSVKTKLMTSKSFDEKKKNRTFFSLTRNNREKITSNRPKPPSVEQLNSISLRSILNRGQQNPQRFQSLPRMDPLPPIPVLVSSPLTDVKQDSHLEEDYYDAHEAYDEPSSSSSDGYYDGLLLNNGDQPKIPEEEIYEDIFYGSSFNSDQIYETLPSVLDMNGDNDSDDEHYEVIDPEDIVSEKMTMSYNQQPRSEPVDYRQERIVIRGSCEKTEYVQIDSTTGRLRRTSSSDEKKLQRDQKLMEKRRMQKAQHLLKKFSLTGQEVPVNYGIVKEDAKRTKCNLKVKKGETVLILRIENNPPGLWLAKDERSEIGYVELSNIAFDPESVKEIMKVRDSLFSSQ